MLSKQRQLDSDKSAMEFYRLDFLYFEDQKLIRPVNDIYTSKFIHQFYYSHIFIFK